MASCTKSFTLKVNPEEGAILLCWYPFEDVTPPFVSTIDTKNSIPMLKSGSGTITSLAGWVGPKGMLLIPNAASQVNGFASNALLKFDTGFSITGWFVTANIAANDEIAFNYSARVGGLSVLNLIITYVPSRGGVDIYLYDSLGAEQIHEFVAGAIPDFTWQFLTVTYDKTSGEVQYQRNNGAVTTCVQTYILPSTPDNGILALQAERNGVAFYQAGFDEVNLWDGKMTAAEINTVWNGGLGKTYP